MVGPRPRVLLTLPLLVRVRYSPLCMGLFILDFCDELPVYTLLSIFLPSFLYPDSK